MKKLIPFFAVLAFIALPTLVQAQEPDTVTIRQINQSADFASAPDITSFQDSLLNSTYFGTEVVFTAIIMSNPRSSGLASATDNTGDGDPDYISRLHIFVQDTTANSAGRDGMSIQIVESSSGGTINTWLDLAQLNRGSVITVNGVLGSFNFETQMDVISFEEIGTVNADFPEFAPLLEPREVSIADLNIANPDGTYELNKDNYWRYNQAYIRVTDAVVSNVTGGIAVSRPDWAVNNNGSRMYTYDTSLRYRNDRATYISSFNFRRGVDGDFVPPAPGSVINLNGFAGLVGSDHNVDSHVAPGQASMHIRPMEDGVVWVNNQRFVNGENITWPDDVELLGSPPLFSNVMQSDSAVVPEDQVTISATIVGVAGNTVQEAKLFWTAQGAVDSTVMTANGDVYSGTIPSFPAATTVNFWMTAVDNEDLSVRNPLSGNYGYFVDGDVASIVDIQKTLDGGPGDSPLSGAGVLSANITATVTTSALEDGFVAVQEKASAWSGIFLDGADNVDTLEVGEVINITSLEVGESFGVTELENIEFTVVGMNTMVDTMAVTGLNSADVRANIEPYEGVLVTFENVVVSTNQADGPGNDFGEFEFASLVDDEPVSGLRYDDRSSRFSSSVNETIKIGASFESITGIGYFSFSNPKLIGGDPGFFVSDDFTFADPRFNLVGPDDGAQVEVTDDITVAWEPTTDFDGNDVSYEWVLYAAADSSEIVAVPSNMSGADTTVTLDFATVDGLLAGAGLEVGQSADFLWNVRVNDGNDTLNVSTSYDIATNSFDTLYYTLELTRGMQTSNENETGLPVAFSLEQNYPNPFNPSTNINFALPQTSRVTLTVYDMLGRKVATLVNGEQLQAANHSIKFDASALASGMYIYRIEAGSFVSTRKMMLIK